MDPVTFKAKDEAPAVSIYYQNPNPERASEVTSRIADLFLSYHQRAAHRGGAPAAKIIEDRANRSPSNCRPPTMNMLGFATPTAVRCRIPRTTAKTPVIALNGI